MAKKSVYVFVKHVKSASKKERNKWDVFEEVHIKNQLKNHLVDSASIILDCENKEVIKDRSNTNSSYDDIINYLAKNHKSIQDLKHMYEALENAERQYAEGSINDDGLEDNTTNVEISLDKEENSDIDDVNETKVDNS